MDDIARQAPPASDTVGDLGVGDNDRRIPIKDVLRFFREAGIPRDIRSLQRYCENGLLDGIKELTATGETWFVAEDSIEPAITQLKQMHTAKHAHGGGQTTTGPQAQPVASPVVAPEKPVQSGPVHDGQGATPSDTDGPKQPEKVTPDRPADDDKRPDVSGHVAQLEKRLEEKDDEISFLRGEVATKNRQLAEASERDRETNILIQGLQSMVLQLTGNDRPVVLAEYHAPRAARHDHDGNQSVANNASSDHDGRDTQLQKPSEKPASDVRQTPPPAQPL